MSDTNNAIDQQVQQLQGKSEDELWNIIGAYALSQEPVTLSSTLAMDGKIDAKKLKKAGEEFLAKLAPVIKEAICGQDGVLHYIEEPTVKDILGVILPLLGLSEIGMVPTAIISVSIIIMRAGLREYCKG